MNTVYKYNLAITDTQTISLPQGSTILCVQNQQDKIFLWAQVDPNITETSKREIRIFDTGHPIENCINIDYIGTVQTHNGNFVWHIYEEFQ